MDNERSEDESEARFSKRPKEQGKKEKEEGTLKYKADGIGKYKEDDKRKNGR